MSVNFTYNSKQPGASHVSDEPETGSESELSVGGGNSKIQSERLTSLMNEVRLDILKNTALPPLEIEI